MLRNIFVGKERRRYIRLKVQLDVDFTLDREWEAHWYKGTTRDISLEGIGLSTAVFSKEEWDGIIQKKQRIRLIIYLSEDKAEKIEAEGEACRIDVEARVVWREEENIEGKDVCIIGLYFTRIEKDAQELIRSFITDHLLKAYRPA